MGFLFFLITTDTGYIKYVQLLKVKYVNGIFDITSK